MTLQKGDIVLVQFPFADLSQTKLRPAVVLSVISNPDEVTLYFISSQNVANLSPEELAINSSDSEFQETGLRVSSKVRVTRIVTLESRLLLRRLGKLVNQQMQPLNTIMIQAFQLK